MSMKGTAVEYFRVLLLNVGEHVVILFRFAFVEPRANLGVLLFLQATIYRARQYVEVLSQLIAFYTAAVNKGANRSWPWRC